MAQREAIDTGDVQRLLDRIRPMAVRAFFIGILMSRPFFPYRSPISGQMGQNRIRDSTELILGQHQIRDNALR